MSRRKKRNETILISILIIIIFEYGNIYTFHIYIYFRFVIIKR